MLRFCSQASSNQKYNVGGWQSITGFWDTFFSYVYGNYKGPRRLEKGFGVEYIVYVYGNYKRIQSVTLRVQVLRTGFVGRPFLIPKTINEDYLDLYLEDHGT